MKLQDLKEDVDALVARLTKAGGKVYCKIAKGGESGWLGVNGTGKSKVYFAFYPDGSSQRFEKPVEAKDLKAGWKAEGSLADPETVLADKAKADKLQKEVEREKLFTTEITINSKELQKLCVAQHADMGSRWQDAYVDGDRNRGVKTIDGKAVAWAKYTIYVYNDDYSDDEDESNGPEIHDPVYALVWRDAKNPEKLHVKDVT